MVATTTTSTTTTTTALEHTPEALTNGEHDPVSEAATPLAAGIIYPPPDIRNIVDRTAIFVSRNGPSFEDRIRENEKKNAKFCFLNPEDPYHAYYQHKIQEVRLGKGDEKKSDVQQTDVETLVEKPKKYVPPEPPAYRFTADLPAISAQDLDILKLTAQFVARNGRQFITSLGIREARNYQFDFLRPTHSLFGFFMKLVDHYSKILVPDRDLLTLLQQNAANKYKVLERVMQRVEFSTYQEEEKKKEEEKQDAERAAYAAIDWHDFVVVETVEFADTDDTLELRPPMSIMDLQTMSIAQKRMEALTAAVIIPDDEDDVDMESGLPVEPHTTAAAEKYLKPKKAPTATAGGPAAVKIRTDYIPKALGGNAGAAPSEPMQLCPRCNHSFPVSEMAEHMRVELLDPKWREQKEANDAKRRDTNLLREGTDVAKNLSGFSTFRSDIFGSADEVEIGKKVNEDAERARIAEKQKVIWDGHSGSIGRTAQQAAKGGWPQPPQPEDAMSAYGRRGDNIGPQFPQQQQPLPPQNFHYPPTHQMGYAPQQHYAPPPSGPGGYPSYGSQFQQAPFSNAIPPPPGSGAPPPPGGIRPPAPPAYMRTAPAPYPGGSVMAPPPGAPLSIPQPPPTLARTAPSDSQQPEPKRTKWGTLIEPVPELAEPTFTITVNTPTMPDKPEWHLTGEPLLLSDVTATMMVKEVKNRIESRLGMPAGKQKLVSAKGVVMKNQDTVATYGLSDGEGVTLEFKAK